jgi:hypothetical protein
MGKLTVIFPMGFPQNSEINHIRKPGFLLCPISQLMDVMIPWLYQWYHINKQDMVISCDISYAQK